MFYFKNWIVLSIIVLISQFFSCGLAGQTIANLDETGVALHGYDPVSYRLGKPQKGVKDISTEFNGVRYLFSTRDNLEKFLAGPEAFVPAFGGWCAWAMLEGEKVDVDPLRYKLIDGVTYLYYNSFFAETLSKWNALAEKRSEKVLVNTAAEMWQKVSSRKGP